jgi:poly(hydroxyalkanoate) granule-associated protein
MTYRHLQKRLRETRKLEETLTLASQIWLAGLGALARAQQEGRDFFDDLVQCGEVIEGVEDDGLRDIIRLARWVLGSNDRERTTNPTTEDIRSLAEAIQNFDPHFADLDLR